MRAIALLAIAAVVLLAGDAAAPLGMSMDAPSWTVGDFWEYAFNTTFGDSVRLEGHVRADILAVRTVLVRDVTQDVFVIDTLGSGTLEGVFPSDLGSLPAQGTWNLTGEQFVTVGSRKIVKSLLDIRASGRAQVPPVGERTFAFSWRNSTSNRVEADGWTYPVALGTSAAVTLNSSWSDDVTIALTGFPAFTFNSAAVSTQTLTLTLERTDTMAVPAGTFEIFVIGERWPDGSREEFDFAPAAGNNARTVSYNESGEPVSRTELTGFRYQAAEPKLNVFLIVGLGGGAVALAAVAAVIILRLRRTRRAREEQNTPPSLREPPT